MGTMSEQLCNLVAQGLTVQEISDIVGVGKQTVTKRLEQLNIKAQSGRSKPKPCIECDAYVIQMYGNKHKLRVCSLECFRRQDLKRSLSLDAATHASCKICGYRAKDLTTHVRQTHKTSTDGYQAKYGKLTCEDVQKAKRERMAGELNYGYQHGGTQSAFSNNYIYANRNPNHKEDAIRASKLTKANQPEKENTKLEYYISKGLTEGEAVIARSMRQRTFSLDICIQKYGPDFGTIIWEDRQHRWRATLMSKFSQEELTALCLSSERWRAAARTSGPEVELVGSLRERVPELDVQVVLVGSNMTRVFDIGVGKRLIEFNGDYWHMNPAKYAADVFNQKTQRSARQTWARDLDKIQLAESQGFQVLAIWESDYKRNKQEVIDKCIAFLTS